MFLDVVVKFERCKKSIKLLAELSNVRCSQALILHLLLEGAVSKVGISRQCAMFKVDTFEWCFVLG